MNPVAHRDRELLLHFLAAIAYRTQKALRDAPDTFADFAPGHQARSPVQVLRHMTSLMGYAQTLFRGGSYPYHPDPLASFAEEVQRFHAELEGVAALLRDGSVPLRISTEQFLQGPLSDTMTHVGQLAMLRRLSESPVAPENFIQADIRADRLGVHQALPVAPDADWPERPS